MIFSTWWEAGASDVVFGVVERETRACNVVVSVWVFKSNRQSGYALLDAVRGWVVCKAVDGREASTLVLRVVERETRFCWSGERDQKHRFVRVG